MFLCLLSPQASIVPRGSLPTQRPTSSKSPWTNNWKGPGKSWTSPTLLKDLRKGPIDLFPLALIWRARPPDISSLLLKTARDWGFGAIRLFRARRFDFLIFGFNKKFFCSAIYAFCAVWNYFYRAIFRDGIELGWTKPVVFHFRAVIVVDSRCILLHMIQNSFLDNQPPHAVLGQRSSIFMMLVRV